MKLPKTTMRFGQLLISALKDAGYIEDYENEYGSWNHRFVRDIFYLSDQELEKILADFVEKNPKLVQE